MVCISEPRIQALLRTSHVGFGMKLQGRIESHPCTKDIYSGLAVVLVMGRDPHYDALHQLHREAKVSCLLDQREGQSPIIRGIIGPQSREHH